MSTWPPSLLTCTPPRSESLGICRSPSATSLVVALCWQRPLLWTIAVPTFQRWVFVRIQFVLLEGSINMVREEGSRWDVGTKDGVITLERFDESDERVSEDVLEVGEARELASLLTKYADKLDSSDKDDSNDDDDSSAEDDSKDEDDSEGDETSEDS